MESLPSDLSEHDHLDGSVMKKVFERSDKKHNSTLLGHLDVEREMTIKPSMTEKNKPAQGGQRVLY